MKTVQPNTSYLIRYADLVKYPTYKLKMIHVLQETESAFQIVKHKNSTNFEINEKIVWVDKNAFLKTFEIVEELKLELPF